MLLAEAAAAKSAARRLEAVMDALRASAEADPKLAFYSLLNACHDTLDALEAVACLPPISGGAPDPTPLEVLALDAEFSEPGFTPSIQDWLDYHAA